MSVERVKSFFEQYGMKDRILEFDVSSATVELAAAALSCEPGRIAKTLSFMGSWWWRPGIPKSTITNIRPGLAPKPECFPLWKHRRWWDMP